MNKHEVYVVGGAVRNVLMGVPVKDMDYVVVGATPEEMLAAGYEQVGADFPVFLKNGDEYALARTERKSGKGYHGFEVDANSQVTLEDDLVRRDLTINAMAVPVDKWDEFVQAVNKYGHQAGWFHMVDPQLGRFDVAKLIARPCRLDTFVEDPLRLVRVARFTAIYGLVWSAEMNEAARHIVDSGEMASLSQERFFAEIEKVLKDAPNASAVREFSLRLMQFKLLPEGWFYTLSAQGIVAKMALMQFERDERKSMGAKLNALCPQGLEDAYAARFKFSGALLDQIDFTHAVLNTACMMAAADATMPMGSANTLLIGVYESIRSGKAGITTEFVAELAEDYEEVKLVLKWLPGVEQIYKDVCFATVEMDPDTPKRMYGVHIAVARQQAVSKMLSPD